MRCFCFQKFVRRSKRQTKRVTYAIVKNRKDESSEDDGSSESDLEEQSEVGNSVFGV